MKDKSSSLVDDTSRRRKDRRREWGELVKEDVCKRYIAQILSEMLSRPVRSLNRFCAKYLGNIEI